MVKVFDGGEDINGMTTLGPLIALHFLSCKNKVYFMINGVISYFFYLFVITSSRRVKEKHSVEGRKKNIMTIHDSFEASAVVERKKRRKVASGFFACCLCF